MIGLLSFHQAADKHLYGRHARGPADKDDLVDVVLGKFGIGKCLLDGTDTSIDQVVGKLIELRSTQILVQMFRPGGIRSNKRKADVCFHHTGQLDLRLLRGLRQTLQRLAVLS